MFQRRPADVAVAQRWAQVARISGSADVRDAMTKLRAGAGGRYVSKITFNVAALRILEEKLVNETDEKAKADLMLVRELKAIHLDSASCKVQNAYVAAFRRARTVVDGWVTASKNEPKPEDNEKWRDDVNNLAKNHKIDLHVYCAREESLNNPIVRWRPKWDFRNERRVDPELREKNWLCASYAKVEKHGLKYLSVELCEDGRVWATARDMSPTNPKIKDPALSGITFFGERPMDLCTARIGPVLLAHGEIVLLQAELLSEVLGWELGKGGWQMDTQSARTCYISAVVDGVEPMDDVFQYKVGDELVDAKLEVVLGEKSRPEREKGDAGMFKWVPKKRKETTEVQAAASTTAEGQAVTAPATVAAAAGGVQHSGATKDKVKMVKVLKAAADDGWCAPMTISEELKRAGLEEKSREEIQQLIKKVNGPAAWYANDLCNAAKLFNVTVIAEKDRETYLLGKNEDETRTLYVKVTSGHLRAFTKTEREKLIAEGPNARVFFMQTEDKFLKLRGLRMKGVLPSHLVAAFRSLIPGLGGLNGAVSREQTNRRVDVRAAAIDGDEFDDETRAMHVTAATSGVIDSNTPYVDPRSLGQLRDLARSPDEGAAAARSSEEVSSTFANNMYGASVTSGDVRVSAHQCELQRLEHVLPQNETSVIRRFERTVNSSATVGVIGGRVQCPPFVPIFARECAQKIAQHVTSTITSASGASGEESVEMPAGAVCGEPEVGDVETRLRNLLELAPVTPVDDKWINMLLMPGDGCIKRDQLGLGNARVDGGLRDVLDSTVSAVEIGRWFAEIRAEGTSAPWRKRMSLLAYDAAREAAAGTLDLSKPRLAVLAWAGGWSGKVRGPVQRVARGRGARAVARGGGGRRCVSQRKLRVTPVAASAAAAAAGPATGADAGGNVDNDHVVISSSSDEDEDIDVEQRPVVMKGEESIEELLQRFRSWVIAHEKDASHIERLLDLGRATRSRIPRKKFTRDFLMRIMSCAAELSLTGNEAAEVLVAAFPRVFLRKGVEVRAALEELLERRDPPQRDAAKPITDDERLVRALTAYAEDRDVTGIYRVLDHFSSAAAKVDPDTVRDVAKDLFARQMEHEVDGDEYDFMRQCGLTPEGKNGNAVRVTSDDVRRWAFRKARRAADLYGWCGSLVAGMVVSKRGFGEVLAKLANKAPGAYASGTALSAVLREAKGSLIPKAGRIGAYRPIAICSMLRRIWTAKAVAEVRRQASAYCERRGQLGLAGGGASIAYATLARMAVANGGTVCTDDKKNSFGSLGRKYVIAAVGDLVKNEPSVDMHTRGVLEAILTRTFVSEAPVAAGQPTGGCHRTTHVYPCADGVWHTNHALTQGSAESSLLEAVTYASIVKVLLAGGHTSRSRRHAPELQVRRDRE